MNKKTSFYLFLSLLALSLTAYLEWEAISNFSAQLLDVYNRDGSYNIFRDPRFNIVGTFIICCLFVLSLLRYVKEFDPGCMIRDLFVPAMILFFAFNWVMVLTRIEIA